MAQYPSSAAGDNNLYIAVNNTETTLVGALLASGGNNGADIEVASTTGFPATGFITIENEAISYSSLLSGPPRFSGITRGADGTTATTHANSLRVRHTQIAAHHNALKEEVKAVENDLVAAKGALTDTDTPAATATDIKDRLDHIVTQVKSLSGETNWYDTTTARVKRSGDTMSGHLAMGTNKVTGLGAASTNGDAVRYEQVNGVYLPLTGGTVTGDIVLDNQKELRLRETTGGGTEYVSLKAPATLGSSVNLTLPSDAGVSGYALKTDGSGVLSWGQASGGTKNYITNNDAEGGITGWATYADAASTDPVDGTGGSPNTTLTASGTNPLSGTYSFLVTKDAANRQGEGCSVNFDIDASDKAKMLYISFDYLPSANFVDDDMSVWLYDRTNGVLIQPAPTLIKKVGQSERWSGEFQTASNSTAYRLIIHIRSTNASAYTLQFDNVKVGPSYSVMGSPVTDWKAYTPIWTASGTSPSLGNGQLIGFYRRVGDSVEVNFSLTIGSGTTLGTGYWKFSLPAGLTQSNTGDDPTYPVGEGYASDSGTGYVVSTPYMVDTTHIAVLCGTGFTSSIGPTVPFTWTTNDALLGQLIVPIVGWSSSVLMSDNADTRVVAARYTDSTGTTLVNASETVIDFQTKEIDTHGAVTTGSGWKFTAPVAGYYRVSARIRGSSAGWTQGESFVINLFKNTSSFTRLAFWIAETTVTQGAGISGTTIISLNAGDYVQLKASQDSGANFNLVASGFDSHVSIERISGPSQIAASETVACQVYKNTSQAVANGGGAVKWAIDLKQFDSHGAFDTSANRFNVPVSGLYRVVMTYSMTGTSVGQVQSSVWKNGAMLRGMERQAFEDNAAHSGTTLIRCVAGDYLEGYFHNYGTASINILGGVNGSGYAYSVLEIERIGNYF